jgi:hypothetical protein
MEQATTLSSSFLSVDADRLLALSNQTICKGVMRVQKGEKLSHERGV